VTELPVMSVVMLCNMLTLHCPIFGTRGRFKNSVSIITNTFSVNVNIDFPELPCLLEVPHSGWIFVYGNSLLWGTRYKRERSRVRLPVLSLEFFIDIILPVALWALESTQPLTEMNNMNISWGG
jgi:hypothetical protein